MGRREKLVSEERKYAVIDVAQAKEIARLWLEGSGFPGAVGFGLPEIDDRYHIWRVPLLHPRTKEKIGECVISARTANVQTSRSTRPALLRERLAWNGESKILPLAGRQRTGCTTSGKRGINSEERPPKEYRHSPLENTVGLGDAGELLKVLPDESIDLMFTSPPYYNARVEYTDYHSYEEYLEKVLAVLKQVHRVLGEGRFAVMNVAPVLLRRARRSEASRRLAVPFDMHRLFIEAGFDFIDDIIWVKPEGAGWATGRGRRFAADRQPLQYKAVPVTEYVLVYRKRTDLLIDWHIRNHPDQELVRKSRVPEEYEKTNIWKIHPANRPEHPAVFPLELARKVIQYYSFLNDVVLDPFAGVGTLGEAAIRLGRRFVLLEKNPEYVEVIKKDLQKFLGKKVAEVNWINCEPGEMRSRAAPGSSTLAHAPGTGLAKN
jgi:DNA modification methylase